MDTKTTSTQSHRSQQSTLAFRPHPLLRPSLAQTLLSMRRPPDVAERLRASEQPILFDAGKDTTGYESSVRLIGYYNPAQPSTAHASARRGLVMTLHGWTGCSHSTYNLVLSDALLRAGYDVVRLNLRDHGPNYYLDRVRLNTGIFLGTLIEEAAVATRRVAELADTHPFYIVGASMGGNFALRLALWHARQPFPNLRRVVAISPAIDPATATDAIDANPLYRHYFRTNWLDSLLAKQAAFPHLFDLTALESISSIRAMTDWLIQRYSIYKNTADYFAQYAVRADALRALTVPTTIIMARNDHVIPSTDFAHLPDHPILDLRMYETGGHVGFMHGFPPQHVLPDMVLASFNQDDRSCIQM